MFDINAQILLSAPKNLKAIRNTIQKELGNITVPVRLSIDKSGLKQISDLNKRVSSLESQIKAMSNAAAKANTTVNALNSSTNKLANTQKNLSSSTTSTNAGLQRTAKNTKLARTEMEAFGKDAALAIRRFSAFTIATGAIYGFVRSIQGAVSKSIEFQRELSRLVQVADATQAQLKSVQSTVDELATSLGIDANELLKTAVTFAQAGQSINEVEDSLRAVARASLTPSFGDMQETTEGVIAALEQFDIQANRTEAVLGSINAVSKAFAVESEDLIAVIRRAGGVFAAASNDLSKPEETLSELLAIFTSVRSTTRESAETIATGLRTIFSRLQRPGTIEFLKQFNIDLVDTEGKFVGFYEAFRRISTGLESITARGDTLTLAKVVEELGGIRQISKLLPAIQQFSKAEAARKVALEGTESISKDVAIATETLSSKIQQLQQNFEKLIRDITDSSAFQNMAKFAIETANAFITLADALRPALPLLTTVAAIKVTRSAFDFAGGFIGGIKRGGGAKSIGSNFSDVLTGGAGDASSKATTQKVLDNLAALNKNTQAIEQLTKKIDLLTSRIGGGPIRKFAKGGYVNGPSHAAGGVMAELEGGEYVVPKKDTKKFARGGLFTQYGKPTSNFAKVLPLGSKKITEKEYDALDESVRKEIESAYDKKFNKTSSTTSPIIEEPQVGKKGGKKKVGFKLSNRVIGLFLTSPKKGKEATYTTQSNRSFDLPSGDTGIIRKGSTVRGYVPHRNAIEKNIELQNTFTKILEESLYNGVVKNVQAFSDSLDNNIINLDGNRVKAVTNKMANDKQVNSTMNGYMFEGFLSAITGADLEGGQKALDFKSLNASNKKALNMIYGLTNELDVVQAADAKYPANNSSFESIIKKIGNVAAQGNFVGVDRLAAGGQPSVANTLLTPEELVFGPKAVRQAGLSNLHHFNKTGDASRLGDFNLSDVKSVPGTGNADTFPAVLPNNSFVVKKKSAKKFTNGGSVGGTTSASSSKTNIGGIFSALAQSGTELFFVFQSLAALDFNSFDSLVQTIAIGSIGLKGLFENFARIKAVESEKIKAEAEATKSLHDLAAATNSAISSLSSSTDALSMDIDEVDLLTQGVLDNSTRDLKEGKGDRSLRSKQDIRSSYSDAEKAKRKGQPSRTKGFVGPTPVGTNVVRNIGQKVGGSLNSVGSAIAANFNPSLIAKAFKPSMGAIIASLAVGPITDAIAKGFGKVQQNGVEGFENGSTSTAAGIGAGSGALSGALSGGGTGALAGSAFGPIGTAIGGAVGGISGAIIGGIGGAFNSVKNQLKFNKFTELNTVAGKASLSLQELGNNLDNQDKVSKFLDSQTTLSKQALATAKSLADLDTKSSTVFNEFGNILGRVTGNAGIGTALNASVGALNIGEFVDNIGAIKTAIQGDSLFDSANRTANLFQTLLPDAINNFLDETEGRVRGIDPKSFAKKRSEMFAASLQAGDLTAKGENFSKILSGFDPNEIAKSAETSTAILDTFIQKLSLKELQALQNSTATSTLEYINAIDDVSPALSNLDKQFKDINNSIGLAASVKVNEFGNKVKDNNPNAPKFDATVSAALADFNKSLSDTGDTQAALRSFTSSIVTNLETSLKSQSDVAPDFNLAKLLNIDPSKINDLNVVSDAMTKLDTKNLALLAKGFDLNESQMVGLIGQLKGLGVSLDGVSLNSLQSRVKAELLAKSLQFAYKELDALSAALEVFAVGASNATADFSIAMENANNKVSSILETTQNIKATKRVNPFENLAGRSDKEIQAGIDRLGKATGNTETFGGLGAALQLNRDLPSALKDAIDTLKSQTANVSAGSFTSTKIQDQFQKSIKDRVGADTFDKIPQEIKDALTLSLQKAVGDAGGNRQEGGGTGGSSIGISSLEAQLETSMADINNRIRSSIDPMQKALADGTNAINEFEAQVIEAGNIQLQTYRLEAKTAIENLNRRKALEDRLGKFTNAPEATVAQNSAALSAQLEAMLQAGTGVESGINPLNVNKLLERRGALEGEQAKIQKQVDDGNLTLVDALAKVTAQLEGTKTAIDALSTDITVLEATESELANIEKSRMSAQERAQFLTSQLAGAKNPQERAAAYNELLKPITAALKAARGETLNFAEADSIFKNRGTVQDFFGANDAQMEKFIASTTAGVQNRAALDIGGLAGNGAVGREAAKRLFGAGAFAPGTDPKSAELLDRARFFADEQAKLLASNAARSKAAVGSVLTGDIGKAAEDARFKSAQANDQARALRGQLPGNNTVLQQQAPQRAQEALAKISNDFNSVFTNGAAAFTPLINNLITAADKLQALPALKVDLNAKVGPVEVILNGANIINTFGDKMKSEILNAVSEKLRTMGLVRNSSGELSDTSL